MSESICIEPGPGGTLLPLEQFDQPPLHRRPANIIARQADRQMDMLVRKQCAGLRQDLRVPGARLRHAFIFGRFTHRERAVLQWTVSGMRDFLFPTWHSLCALTIFELARGMRVLGPEAGGYAHYLNQWGRDASRPLPSAAGWMLHIRDCSRLPPAAVDMLEGDPCREDLPEIGASTLNVDGLLYSVPTAELRKLQAARGLLNDSADTLA